MNIEATKMSTDHPVPIIGDVPSDDPRIVALGLEPAVSTAALYRNVDRIKDLLRAEAPKGDAMGRTTPLAGRAMRDAGIFAMQFPKSRGGIGISLPDQTVLLSRLARIDGGTCWTGMILSNSGSYAAQLSDEGYKDLFPTVDMPTSFSIALRNAALDDGDSIVLRKGSVWDFGSGIYHAERFLGAARLVDGEGKPSLDADGHAQAAAVFIPPEKVRILHNWNPMGIRSSGSSSYGVDEDVRVPKKHSFPLFPMRSNPDAAPNTKHPETGFMSIYGVAVGIAQHALDLAIASVRNATTRFNAPPSSLALTNIDRMVSEVNAIAWSVRGMMMYFQNAVETPGRMLTDEELEMTMSCGTPIRDALNRVIDLAMDIYGTAWQIDPNSEIRRVIGDAAVLRGHMQYRPALNAQDAHTWGRGRKLIENPDAATTILDTPWELWIPRGQ